MITSDFTIESSARGAIARWHPEEEAQPLSYMEHCDYDQFLRILVEKHGQSYLMRPDGSLLDGVVVLPQVEKVVSPQHRVVFVERTRMTALDIRERIVVALRDGPRSMSEIAMRSGLGANQITNAISIDRGETFYRLNLAHINDKWGLVSDKSEDHRSQPPSMVERTVAYLRKHGPSTAHDIAHGLGASVNTIAITCYQNTEFVNVGRTGKRKIWGLRDEPTL